MIKPKTPSLIAPILVLAICLSGSSKLLAREGFFLFDGIEYEPPVATTPDGSVKFEVYGDTAVTEGDIIIGSARSLITGLKNRGLSRTDKQDQWFDGIVYYEVDENIPQPEQDKVEAAIEHWNTYTSLTLIERTPAIEADVPDYIFFESYPACASWVGRIGGPQKLNVGSQCTTGSLIHEIGHAVGLFHEHTRVDRDDFVTVVWGNIKDKKAFNFDIVSDGVSPILAYDYNSIMHYGTSFFSINGQPTISPPDGVTIGQREKLSEVDLASINELYATDLALLSQLTADAAANAVTISLTIDNIGDVGAHGIEYLMPLGEGQQLVSSVQSDWTCESSPGYISCKLWRLSDGSQSQLSLLVKGTADVEKISDGFLRSKSFDADTDNNGSAFELPTDGPEKTEDGEVVDETQDQPQEQEPEDTTDVTPEAEPTVEPAPQPAQANNATSDAGGSLDGTLGLSLLSVLGFRYRRRISTER